MAMYTASRTPTTSVERVEEAHRLLTIKEAAAEMRICLSHAYELAYEYLNSRDAAGPPVLRFGTCMRVPRSALDVLITPSTQYHGPDNSQTAPTMPLSHRCRMGVGDDGSR